MGNRSEEKAYIDLICYPLNSLGPETRVGIWFQGCDIGCDDCIATFTWQQTNNNLISVKELVYKIQKYETNRLTISGGEPFNQPKVLYSLLLKVRENFDDILIYSGYEYNYLKQRFSYILELVDVLIDGPFVKTLPTKKAYKGSKNQKMYIFNKSLIRLYESYIMKTKENLQLYQTEDKVYVLGIPHISDTKNIQKVLNGGLEDER